MPRSNRILLSQPRWILAALLVVALAGGCILLGRWQLSRLDEREARNAVLRHNLAVPAGPLAAVLPAGQPVTRQLEWRAVSVSGQFLADQQYVAKYRNRDGAPGFQLLVLFRNSDGRVLIVDRGFLPRSAGSSAVPAAPPLPPGQTTITGRLRRSEHGDRDAVRPVDGAVRLINAPAIEAASGRDLLDGYLSVDHQQPAAPAVLRPAALPQINGGPHFFYALQWFFFGVLAIAGLVHFTRLELRDRTASRNRDGVPADDRPRNSLDTHIDAE